MQQKPLVMIIDDDIENIGMIADILEQNNYEIAVATSGEQAVNIIPNIEPDLILLDVMMPGISGIKLCRILKGKNKEFEKEYMCFGKAAEIPIIFQTGKTEIDDIVKGFDAGAIDYITKPFNAKELLARVKTHVDLRLTKRNLKVTENQLKESNTKLKKEAVGISDVIAESEQMRKVIKKARMLHDAKDIPVLIEGDTGTGKEVVARIIHFGDGDVDCPFVDVNSAVLPKDLFESELFGYDSGAFTGADKKGKQGYFGMANGGTLFLDEIGELPLNLQPKLLRVLQEGTYYKLGNTKKLTLDARIISATNRSLDELVAKEGFRADLFHRLGVGYIFIPPLRERREDIKPIAESILKKLAFKNSLKPKKISLKALKTLENYSWPGNVRELENILRLADFMAFDNIIDDEHLEFRTNIYSIGKKDSGGSIDLENLNIPDTPFDLNDLNNRVIEKCLEKFNNNSAKVANFLGVSRQTIYRFQKKQEEL
jgi:two-component system, NtrC family, response regulator AtoC